ncbi:MAG: hypothetical protein U9N54_02615 [candidate division Zixibacteria bacterium]|nr:hypothetical protein [candidate division Zixibacteria bacterium]
MMHLKKLLGLTLALALFGAILLIGCSDTIEIVSQPNDSFASGSEALSWFPLAEGYQTVYNVKEADGDNKIISFIAGKSIEFQSGTAIEWLSNDPVSGSDTGYFQYTNDAVYYYDSKSSSGEKIIQLPLTLGSSWNRTETISDDLLTNFDDVITGSKDTVIVIPLSKNLPIIGEVTMTVEEATALQLEEVDNYYSSAVRVSVPSSSTKTNYYWFVQGVGLVKYVIGATDSYTNGDIVAELVNYGVAQ